jgi:hypothetical protein
MRLCSPLPLFTCHECGLACHTVPLHTTAFIQQPSPVFSTQTQSTATCNYYFSGQYGNIHSHVFYLKQRFGDWILSPSSGTYED